MPEYHAPLRDVRFVMDEVLNLQDHYADLPGAEEATTDMISAILAEAAKFAENELAPLYQSGDQEGCHWQDGEVTLPKGFKEAYDNYRLGGWPSLAADVNYGGQGLPHSLGIVVNEFIATANWSWAMIPGLSHGAVNTISRYGNEEQKRTYLNKLNEGSWTGTMCLTEPHCGSDLALLKTKVEEDANGSYRINGSKIFISAGEHDLAENIVHIVLARLPDAPEGIKGISLFIVPKFLPTDGGGIGERNGVNCGSLEHKMGIHASPTCVLNFDNAKAWLIGEPHKGMTAMFTYMNSARIGTALQGLSHTELSFQWALAYARERIQMRSLSGVKNPDKPADYIIVHADVRRMLLTQKAFAEGGRCFLYYLTMQLDKAEADIDEQHKQHAEDLLAILTPIAKGFLTETGYEAVNHGLQVFGGHGYIQEWGMEQIVRDCRISTLYEGTTGIQSLDLLGRKVLKTRGELLKPFLKDIQTFCKDHMSDKTLKPLLKKLNAGVRQWNDLTMKIGMAAMKNADAVGAASVDYLMFSGYVTIGYFWARMAHIAQEKLASPTDEQEFYTAKIKTAQFYFERIMPRTQSLVETILSGPENLMSLEAESFRF